MIVYQYDILDCWVYVSLLPRLFRELQCIGHRAVNRAHIGDGRTRGQEPSCINADGLTSAWSGAPLP